MRTVEHFEESLKNIFQTLNNGISSYYFRKYRIGKILSNHIQKIVSSPLLGYFRNTDLMNMDGIPMIEILLKKIQKELKNERLFSPVTKDLPIKEVLNILNRTYTCPIVNRIILENTNTRIKWEKTLHTPI